MSDASIRFRIEGLQRVQANNRKRIQNLDVKHDLGEAAKRGATMAHRYAIYITHVDTGSLRASHLMRMGITADSAYGEIYINPGARNPRTGQRPAVYGPYEHERGGTHAFYTRTRVEHGQKIINAMLRVVRKAMYVR